MIPPVILSEDDLRKAGADVIVKEPREILKLALKA
jgi:hypothetical protein